MEIKDTYFTLREDSEGFFKEKGSKFLAFAYHVKNEIEVKNKVAYLKKKYFDARHHCYAYVLGTLGDDFRVNDDGEPSHSAGDPILGQIRSNKLTYTLIVVVRYFGGTKLGISGLISAYKNAAANALRNNSIIESFIQSKICLAFEYPQLNHVMKLVRDFEVEILKQKMELSCTMTLGIRLSKEAAFRSKIKDFHRIKVVS